MDTANPMKQWQILAPRSTNRPEGSPFNHPYIWWNGGLRMCRHLLVIINPRLMRLGPFSAALDTLIFSYYMCSTISSTLNIALFNLKMRWGHFQKMPPTFRWLKAGFEWFFVHLRSIIEHARTRVLEIFSEFIRSVSKFRCLWISRCSDETIHNFEFLFYDPVKPSWNKNNLTSFSKATRSPRSPQMILLLDLTSFMIQPVSRARDRDLSWKLCK